jgi:hypothetical protein
MSSWNMTMEVLRSDVASIIYTLTKSTWGSWGQSRSVSGVLPVVPSTHGAEINVWNAASTTPVRAGAHERHGSNADDAVIKQWRSSPPTTFFFIMLL